MQFSPTQEGSFSGSVSLDTNGGDVTVSLSGTGVAQPPVLVISTSLLNFGNIAVNDSASLPYSVANAGGGTLTVTETSGLTGTVMVRLCPAARWRVVYNPGRRLPMA